MKAIYITYDGLTDNLGQSQVLPYVIGLAKKGVEFTLISFEKPDKYEAGRAKIEQLIGDYAIQWETIPYASAIPVLSPMFNIRRLQKRVESLLVKDNYDLLHCRSYITSIVGLRIQKKYGIPFIFDMRAFYADERVDGGIWNLKNPLYRNIYKYFKKKEREFLVHSSRVVSLTENGKEEILSWGLIQDRDKIEVIPCCVDMELFNRGKLNEERKAQLSKPLGKDRYIITYIGSIGTWYMLGEMLDFFKVLQKTKPNALFLFVTREDRTHIMEEARKRSIPEDAIFITPSEREDVPYYIERSDACIFFILPVYGKKGSSPTKQGEIMAMGKPIICNSGVGDTDLVIQNYDAGLIIDDLSDRGYQQAIDQLDELEGLDQSRIIRGAREFYALEKGVEQYYKLYNDCLNQH